MPPTPASPRRSNPYRVLAWMLPSLALNAAVVAAIGWGLERMRPPDKPLEKVPMQVMLVAPEPPEEEVPVEEVPPPDPQGQLVEVAKPDVEQVPEQADYLAEHDQVVPEETRTDQFKINPEQLDKTLHEEMKEQSEAAEDVQAEEVSTGAEVGNERFDPDKHGPMAALASKFAKTNKQGTESPTLSQSTSSDRAGAPQNDLLYERTTNEVNLNTKKFLYAGYLNRIRRMVNFYWSQNLDNLSRHSGLDRNQYFTGVNVVLSSEGAIESITVTRASGSQVLDSCVVRAFQSAGPFPGPPAGLIDPDGKIRLEDFGFEVRLHSGGGNYQAVDPRAGVQFPGIMKSPR